MNLLLIAAMVQDVVVVAPGVLQRIREYRHPVEGALLVNPTRQRNDGRCQPRGVRRAGTEWMKQISDDIALLTAFLWT